MMRDMSQRLGRDPELASAYTAAHEDYLRRRGELGEVPELAGISAGGMPTRVKCLHVLVGHALAVGPGVNPLGDEALEALGSWWAGLGLGSLLGRWAVPRQGIVIDRTRRRIAVPGSVVPLILILIIFLGRYASGYAFGRYPELRQDPLVVILAASYAAFCTGVMMGRTAPLVIAYFRAVKLDDGKSK